MALPIAPTPVLTGENAVAFDRYLEESNTKKEELFVRSVDLSAIDKLIEKRRLERERCKEK